MCGGATPEAHLHCLSAVWVTLLSPAAVDRRKRFTSLESTKKCSFLYSCLFPLIILKMSDVALVLLERFLMATEILTNSLPLPQGSVPNPTALCCPEESSEATGILKSHPSLAKTSIPLHFSIFVSSMAHRNLNPSCYLWLVSFSFQYFILSECLLHCARHWR